MRRGLWVWVRQGEQTLIGTMSQVTIEASTEDYSGSGTEGAVDATFVGASPARMNDSKLAPEDAIPLGILQSRVPSRPSTSQGSAVSTQNPFIISSPFMFMPPGRQPHRSLITNFVLSGVVLTHPNDRAVLVYSCCFREFAVVLT
jgi:GDP/GTP exchange factor required for growth at low temperature